MKDEREQDQNGQTLIIESGRFMYTLKVFLLFFGEFPAWSGSIFVVCSAFLLSMSAPISSFNCSNILRGEHFSRSVTRSKLDGFLVYCSLHAAGLNQFSYAPESACNSRRHRWSTAQGVMALHETVISEVQRDRCFKVFALLAERKSKAGQAAHVKACSQFNPST